MIELPAHVEDRLYEIFMELSVPRLLEKEAKKEKALDLAAFFAEFEQGMKKMNRPKIAEFSRKQMIKYLKTYVNTEFTV
ncbi:hypothetical protein [Bacillus amyloliquefaciens]|uniref:hypothetical protein n=1 Tax=Bacillus amyloliquefaciens TaxID=1390 RepID=UPI000B570059|nr:hypothetical protein [Bacillus amyloliquefaciens]ARW39028.1 hypothetical protein S101267_01940 [Bacillus amyloliquefaciens]WBY35461.1 hypothetical protein PF976_09685 [Bacillus amyloliquefaciens]WJM56498.1 hypothetical protein QTN45_10760 [Bacillus amyloliquefaciens]